MSRAVIQPFEEYQRSRVIFVQTVAALAQGKNNKNVDALKRLDAVRLLGPLLTDPVDSIRQYAALALGSLAGADDEVASQVVNDDKGKIMNLILDSLEKTNNRFYKKTACRLLGKLFKWKSLASKVVNSGVIPFLVQCLEDCDGEVKQFAASALQKICENGLELALAVIEAGAIEPLSLCLQEPDINLKRQAVLTMSSIAKHSESCAKKLCEEKENLGVILFYLPTKDITLRRQILLCLSHIAQRSAEKAFQIINALTTPQLEENIAGTEKIIIGKERNAKETRAREVDRICQQNTLSLLYNISKHGQKYATLASGKIKPDILQKFLEENTGADRNAALLVLSYFALFSKEQAETIKRQEGHFVLAKCLYEQRTDTIAYACNVLANMASHPNPDITNGLVDDLPIGPPENVKMFNIPYRLLELCLNPNNPEELKKAAESALTNVIENTSIIMALVPLLDAPNYDKIDRALYGNILSMIVKKMHTLLGEYKIYKRKLIETKTLKKLIKLKSIYPKLEDDLKNFSDFYSQEIMNYYSDEYEAKIKEQALANLI